MAQTILVEGIAESQANVLLRLVLADGRSVRHVLTADEPSFVVPEQEGTLDVIGQSKKPCTQGSRALRAR